MTAPAHDQADPPAEALCRDCVARLDDALRLPPLELGEEVDVVEREVARLRDRLIDQLRRQPDGEAARPRAALGKVNAALSLIVGVEYPAAGIRRKALEQARDTLRQVLEDEAIP